MSIYGLASERKRCYCKNDVSITMSDLQKAETSVLFGEFIDVHKV